MKKDILKFTLSVALMFLFLSFALDVRTSFMVTGAFVAITAIIALVWTFREMKQKRWNNERRREREEQRADAGRFMAGGIIEGVTWLLRVTLQDDAPGHWRLLGALHYNYRFGMWSHKHQIPFTPRVRSIIEDVLRQLETKHPYGDVTVRRFGIFTRRLRYMGWECGPVFRDRDGMLRFRTWPLFLKSGWKRWPAEHEHCMACWLENFLSHRGEVQAQKNDGAPDRLHEHVETNFDMFPLTPAQAALVGVDVNDPIVEAPCSVYWGTIDDLCEVREMEQRGHHQDIQLLPFDKTNSKADTRVH